MTGYGRADVVVGAGPESRARLRAVPVSAVELSEGFWAPRLAANRKTSIPEFLRGMEEHGFLDNFRRAAGRRQVERRGRFATDADVGKWIEAVCWTLASRDDAELRKTLDMVIDEVVAAQGPDGYLNTWYVFERCGHRFSEMGASHELFSAGHLIQAAIAHRRVTGEAVLFDAARRYADYLCEVFDPWKPESSAGHPNAEPALVELYRETGDRRYLDLVRFLLEWQQYTEQREIAGHCVETVYRCCGATDYYAETGDAAYGDAVRRQWDDMVAGKIYLTGGVGSRYRSESFGLPFELPSQFAYCETCAAIANVMWNQRLLLLSGETMFADWMERALYNAFLAGVALEGGRYFYVNPLVAVDPRQRESWHGTPCCLGNVQRLVASVPGYFYGTSPEGVWVHLYDDNRLRWRLADGRGVSLRQETRYPWDGRVTLSMAVEGQEPCSLFLRIPSWCAAAGVTVNGEAVTARPGSYCEVRRLWRERDRVELDLDTTPSLVSADPRVWELSGRVALMRGPLVYCAESVDNPDAGIPHAALEVDPDQPGAAVSSRFEPDLLGGIVAVQAAGVCAAQDPAAAELYRSVRAALPRAQQRPLTLVPYYAWANRGPSCMAVWLPLVVRGERYPATGD